MRRKFLTWLFLLICAAFAVAGALAFAQFQRQAQNRATQIMSTRLNDLLNLIIYTEDNVRHVMEINDASTLESTRALAEIIRLNPSLLESQEELQGICNELGGSQITISNKDGIVEAAVPASLVGSNIADSERTRPFLRCIKEPDFELCQRPQNNGAEDRIIQYAGVARRDKPGVVQLGILGQHVRTIHSAVSLAKLVTDFTLDKNGHIIVFRGGSLVNREQINFPTADLLSLPIDKPGEISISDMDYFTYVVRNGEFRLVGLIPRSDMTNLSLKALWGMLRSNAFLFLVVFILVWILLQKLVLSGLMRIIRSLRRITEGYKEERVNVTSCPEFTRLSTGINAMVDSLQAYTERENQRMQHQLELARAIQTTLLPSVFPAFPDHPEFDIYAASSQSHVIGGDFYDFFMPDPQHVHFLVGDVSGQGIPAALFMMRAVSIIRSMGHMVQDPGELAGKANSALSEGNAPGMQLSLFYGCLHVESGELKYVNAGVSQALLQRCGFDFEMMDMKSGPALGCLSSVTYVTNELTMAPGDRIFLYTSGLCEVRNADKVAFDRARLLKALRRGAPVIKDVPYNVRNALRAFMGGKRPSRDITVLAFEYKGKRCNRASIVFEAGDTERVRIVLDDQLESVFASPLAIQDIQNSIRSILGELPADCPASLSITCDESEAKIELRYAMPRFNPLFSLPSLPLDRTEFKENDEESCTLTILKKLE